MIEDRQKSADTQSPRDSALDAPEHIQGVDKRKDKHAAKPKSDCDSVLDGKECIEGVDEKKQ